MEDLVNLTGLLMTPFRLRQEELLLFLSDTEQTVTLGRYIVICLSVIEKTNFINKAVLEWRRKAVGDKTDALFWPFIKTAHKEKRLKIAQRSNEQTNNVMQQK